MIDEEINYEDEIPDDVCYCGNELDEEGNCRGCGENPEDCECNLEAA